MEKKYAVVIFLAIFIILCLMPFDASQSELNIVGSTSIQPLGEQLANEYKKTHHDIDINVQGGGSSMGIKCVNNSLTDIGMSSKDINCDDFKKYQIGTKAIVVVVNKNNSLKDLSSTQLRDIFSGKIKDWSEISNQSGKINVIVREEGSGTLDAFKSIIMKNCEIKEDAIIQNSPGAIKQAIVQDKNSIGFISLGHVDNNIKNVTLNGVEVSANSIKNDSYVLQRPFLFITNQTPGIETEKFINWTLSDESSEIFEKEKIIKN